MNYLFRYLAVITLSLQSCNTGTKLTTLIPKGKVVSNMAITFANSDRTILPNTFFQLADYNIITNSKTKKRFVSFSLVGGIKNNLTDVGSCLGLMKRNEIINYDIAIKDLTTAKSYFGKIAFFNAHKAYGYSAVNRYYEISIADSFFESSTRGRASISYEYNGEGNNKYPTWIIIMSDEPL